MFCQFAETDVRRRVASKVKWRCLAWWCEPYIAAIVATVSEPAWHGSISSTMLHHLHLVHALRALTKGSACEQVTLGWRLSKRYCAASFKLSSGPSCIAACLTSKSRHQYSGRKVSCLCKTKPVLVSWQGGATGSSTTIRAIVVECCPRGKVWKPRASLLSPTLQTLFYIVLPSLELLDNHRPGVKRHLRHPLYNYGSSCPRGPGCSPCLISTVRAAAALTESDAGHQWLW